MRQISRFIIAGMLGLLTLPAQGAGRGNGAAHTAHASSKSTSAGHVPTHSPQPPGGPSVGGAAPAPVPARKAARESAAAVASAVPDNDPVQDLVPVSESPNDVVSPSTTFQPSAPSSNEFKSRNTRINSSGALRAGADASATTAAPRSTDTMWEQIDAASSHMQALLNKQPEYWAAVARVASAEQRVAAVRSGGDKDADQIRLAAQDALEARQEIAQMQMSTLEADPNFQAALTRD